MCQGVRARDTLLLTWERFQEMWSTFYNHLLHISHWSDVWERDFATLIPNSVWQEVIVPFLKFLFIYLFYYEWNLGITNLHVITSFLTWFRTNTMEDNGQWHFSHQIRLFGQSLLEKEQIPLNKCYNSILVTLLVKNPAFKMIAICESFQLINVLYCINCKHSFRKTPCTFFSLGTLN